MKRIKYVTDSFLDEYTTNFEKSYLPLYRTGDKDKIKEIFSDTDKVIETDKEYDYKPLSMDEGSDLNNIKTIWKSLNKLTPVEAENPKLWVALENTDYLDYHLYQCSLQSGKSRDSSIESRTIFNNGKKRSLAINNIASLWWIAYYLIDPENKDDEYHLVEFFTRKSYRGNAMSLLSSNIVSDRKLVWGILDAVKELVEENKIVVNRYAYTNPNKLLNQIGGVRLLDMLSRDEVKQIIKDNLLDTKNIKTPEQ